MRSENCCTQKQQILCQNAILFLDGEKHLLKDLNNFWYRDRDFASVAEHSSENFSTKMLLYIYFKTVSPLPQKHLI